MRTGGTEGTENTGGTVNERMHGAYIRCGTYTYRYCYAHVEGKVKGYYFARTRMYVSLSKSARYSK